LERAHAVLSSDTRIPALAKDDLMLLRTAFDDLLAQLDDRTFPQRALHGEPHDGNHLLTPSGLRWIDFESACLGPPEWDLAFLPDGARAAFTDVDLDLLALLKVLDSCSRRHLVLGRGSLPGDESTRRAPSGEPQPESR
jgi:aminoglycoside phosphotransferase (APT) family kinase protein